MTFGSRQRGEGRGDGGERRGEEARGSTSKNKLGGEESMTAGGQSRKLSFHFSSPQRKQRKT